jgi:hypothetical protein
MFSPPNLLFTIATTNFRKRLLAFFLSRLQKIPPLAQLEQALFISHEKKTFSIF